MENGTSGHNSLIKSLVVKKLFYPKWNWVDGNNFKNNENIAMEMRQYALRLVRNVITTQKVLEK